MDQPGNAPVDAIERRWETSIAQVADTAAAVRTGRLEMANTPDEIARRDLRLRDHGLRLEAIVDEDDSVWLSFFSRGLAAARAVGRVVRSQRNEPVEAVGTGVLVGPRLLLTNNHVVPDATEAVQMSVQFGYEYADDGTERQPDTCRLDPDAGFHTDEELDFTVVAVADLNGVPPGETYGSVRLVAQVGKALKAEALNVIHHPGGERKRVSVRKNRMVASDDLWLRYTSDTRRGSSGAPVFNDQWEMVALHHGGVPRRDGFGRRLTRAGEAWTDDLNGQPVQYMANEGARVSRIVQRLTEADLGTATAALVLEALGAQVRS